MFGTVLEVMRVVVFRCACRSVVLGLKTALLDDVLFMEELFGDMGSRSSAFKDLINTPWHFNDVRFWPPVTIFLCRLLRGTSSLRNDHPCVRISIIISLF